MILQPVTVGNPFTLTDEVTKSVSEPVIPDFSTLCDSEAVSDCLWRNRAAFTKGGALVYVEYRIELTANVKSFSPPTRRLPPAILPHVKEELDRMSRFY